jgi:hypothetical protein
MGTNPVYEVLCTEYWLSPPYPNTIIINTTLPARIVRRSSLLFLLSLRPSVKNSDPVSHPELALPLPP